MFWIMLRRIRRFCCFSLCWSANDCCRPYWTTLFWFFLWWA